MKTFRCLVVIVCLLYASESHIFSPSLEFTIEPSSVLANPNESVQLDCSAVLVGTNQHHPHRHHMGFQNSNQKSRAPFISWRKDDLKFEFGKDENKWVMLSNGSLLINRLEPKDEGLYQCVACTRGAVDGAGDQVDGALGLAIISKYARITVLDSDIRIIKQPEDIQVAVEDVAMFACQTNDVTRRHVIRWYHDDAEIPRGDVEVEFPQELVSLSSGKSQSSGDGASSRIVIHQNGVLEISSVTSQDAGRYRCLVDGSAHSRSALLTIGQEKAALPRSPPQIVFSPEHVTAVEGQLVTLNCAARGRDRNGKSPDIVWLKDGVTIDLKLEENVERVYRVGSNSLCVDFIQEDDSGLYACRAVNAEDYADAYFEVNVKVLARIFDFHPDNNLILEETSDLELPCIAEGNLRPTVTWFKNDEKLTSNEFVTIDPDDDTLSIFGVVPGDLGMYQCVALNDLGSSRSSIKVEVVKRMPHKIRANGLIPGPPLDVSALDVGPRSLTLSWKPPRNHATASVIGYTVVWTDQLNLRERRVNTSESDTEVAVNHLRPGLEYHFKVVTFSRSTYGHESPVLTAQTPLEAVTPTMPASVRCHPLSSTSIHLSWTPTGVDSNGPVTSYKIYYREMDKELSSFFTRTSASTFYLSDDYDVEDEDDAIASTYRTHLEIETIDTKFTFSRFSPGSEYTFRVIAHAASGASPAAREVTCRTYSDVPLQAPQNVSLEVLSSTSLVLRWNPPSTEFQNGIIVGYKIRWKMKDAERVADVLVVDGATVSLELNDLWRSTQYSVRIQALTVNGSGPPSSWVTAETFLQDLDESVVPGKPSSLRVRPLSNSIGVSWSPPSNTSVVVRGYLLEYGVGVPNQYKMVLDARQRYHNIRGLRPMTEYVITLRALNNKGDGESIIEAVATKDESIVPELTPAHLTPPVGLKASTVSSTTIRVSWTDPNDLRSNNNNNNNNINKQKNKNNYHGNHRNGNGNHNNHYARNGNLINRKTNYYYHYTVRVIPKAGISNRKLRVINSSDTVALINDLLPDTQYEFSVKAVAGKQESAWSLSVFNRTKERDPSSPPRDLTPSLVGDQKNMVELTWLPPKRANGAITGYLIYHTDDVSLPDREWSLENAGGDTTTITLKDLPARKTRYFKVQARNALGYGPLSPTVTLKVPGASDIDGNLSEEKNSKDSGPNNLPGPVFYAAVGGLAILFIISSILIASLVCYKKRLTKESELNNGTFCHPTLPHKELKPPDLWIHDQIDVRSQDNNRSSGNCSPTNHNHQPHHVITTASSVISNDDSMSLDPGDDDRCLRSAMNFVFRHDHGVNREAFSPLLSTTTTASLGLSATTTTSYRGNYFHSNGIQQQQPQQRQGSQVDGATSGLLGGLQTRTFYSRTPYASCAIGEPAATNNTVTPRVNAGDVAPPPSEQCFTTLGRQKQKLENSKKLGNPGEQRSTTIWPIQLQSRLASLATQPPSSTSTSSPISKQSSTPATTSSAAATATGSPTATAAATGVASSAASEGDDGSIRGLVSCKSISTEELTAEMANLEGLMKDLNAITQSEFNC